MLHLIAPFIFNTLSGPLAQIGQYLIKKTFNLDDNNNIEEFIAKINWKDPETIIKLRQLDMEMAKITQKTDIKLEQIMLEDKKNARDREITKKDRLTSILALSSLIFCCAYVIGITFIEINKEQHQYIMVIFGWLGGIISSIFSYYFGGRIIARKK